MIPFFLRIKKKPHIQQCADFFYQLLIIRAPLLNLFYTGVYEKPGLINKSILSENLFYSLKRASHLLLRVSSHQGIPYKRILRSNSR